MILFLFQSSFSTSLNRKHLSKFQVFYEKFDYVSIQIKYIHHMQHEGRHASLYRGLLPLAYHQFLY